MKLNLFSFGTAAGVLTSATPVNALAANNMDADESGSLDCLGDLMEDIPDEITQSCTGGGLLLPAVQAAFPTPVSTTIRPPVFTCLWNIDDGQLICDGDLRSNGALDRDLIRRKA